MGCTKERICSIRPCRTCPRAMAIMTAKARLTRVCIFARPRMKCRSKPKLLSMRLLIRSRALRRLYPRRQLGLPCGVGTKMRRS